jgi:choline dehydrogenase-like flavoprotein
MTREYEYILVGAGVAAATLAKRLLEKNHNTSILVLEAGPIIPAKNRRYWWDYVVLDRKPYAYTYDQPNEYETLGNVTWDFRENRVTAYGGSTLHWGGWSLRHKPEDFHLYDNTGEGANWPFGYETLEPFYWEAEKYLSVCGDTKESWNHNRKHQPYPVPPFDWTAPDGEMIAAFQALEIEAGRMPIARYRKCLATGTCKYCPVGARFTAQYILDDLRSDERFSQFEVRCMSPVSRILTDSKSRIKGVEYVDTMSGDTAQVFARTVIVCSGAYESPKLLMLSQSNDWPGGIGNDHDLVGRFIISHSMLVIRGTTPVNKECWFQEYDFPTLMSRTYDTPAHQKKGKIMIFKNRAWPNIDFADCMIKGLSRKQIEKMLKGPRIMELQAFLEEKGKFENRLTLGNGRNRFGLRCTQVNFNRTETDTANANDRLDLMKRVLRQMGYGEIRRSVDNPGGHHTTGTCRMGNTPEDGVTDENLRVHGTDNLYVCSNAVFPSGTAVNPTLTLTALAFRLADHLNPAAPRVEADTALAHSN